MKEYSGQIKGLYVHVPFCISKCKYCDFISENISKEKVEKYLLGVKNELEFYGNQLKKELNFDTIYLGGGTPTSLNIKELEVLLNYIFNSVSISSSIPELTIEVNPLTLDDKKTFFIAKYFNRISIGLQTTHDWLLKTLGRIHTYEDFLGTYNLILNYFNNINIDLIYGIPGQSLNELEQDLVKLLELSPKHISLYGLSIEEGTTLYNEFKKGLTEKLPSEDLQSLMYYKAREFLLANAYYHYEISNFCKPGFRSLHNLNYWLRGNYLGIGVGAHSLWDNKRWKNPDDIDEYFERSKKSKEEKINYLQEDFEDLGFYEVLAENIFLGLRLTDGIKLKKLGEKFGLDIINFYKEEIDKLECEGLIEITEDILKLTPKGYMLANRVFMEFLPDLDK